MATFQQGILDTSTAFGKWADYEKAIRCVGFQQTPFSSLVQSVADANRSANIPLGHTWFYEVTPDGNVGTARKEGADAPELYSYMGESLKNEFQIFGTTFGVTGTQEPSTLVNGESVLANQRKNAVMNLKISIEKALIGNQAAVARSKADNDMTGKLAGIQQFLTTNNTIDAANEAISWEKHLRALFQIGMMKGGKQYQAIMMSPATKNAVDDLFNEKKFFSGRIITSKQELNNVVVAPSVTTIADTGYGTGIKVFSNPWMADGLILAMIPNEIYRVNWRPMKETKLATVGDRLEFMILAELTLRVATPYSIGAIKNIKVA